jgi:hypothetical protein
VRLRVVERLSVSPRALVSSMQSSGNTNPWCYTHGSLPIYPLFAYLVMANTAVRIQREVTMESTLTGPILYLMFACGALTAVFVGLLIWRSLLCSHEDDQIFLDAAQEHMAREQRELVAKIVSLSRPIKTSGIAAATLFLVMVGMWLYEGLKSF